MAEAYAVVSARFDRATKVGASQLFGQRGTTVPDATRMMLVQAVAEKVLPFEVRTPNPETVAALAASRNGNMTRFNSIDNLLTDMEYWGGPT